MSGLNWPPLHKGLGIAVTWAGMGIAIAAVVSVLLLDRAVLIVPTIAVVSVTSLIGIGLNRLGSPRARLYGDVEEDVEEQRLNTYDEDRWATEWAVDPEQYEEQVAR